MTETTVSKHSNDQVLDIDYGEGTQENVNVRKIEYLDWGSLNGNQSLTFSTQITVSISNKPGARVVLLIVHRSNLTLPSGWNFVHKHTNKAGWQFISIYEKICTGAETFTLYQANVSNTAMAAISIYINPNKTLEYEAEYYPISTSTPAQFSIEDADYERIFVMSLGYYNSGGVTISPSANGGSVPSNLPNAGDIRICAFYMDGSEGAISITKPGLTLSDSGCYNSSEFCSYKIVDAPAA